MKKYIVYSIQYVAITVTVFLLATYYILNTAPVALAATLYFFPQNIEVFEGENVIVEVRLNTDGETINAVEVEGGLANENMTIDSADTSNSLVRIFIEPAQTDGKQFRFIGGTPGGFDGAGIIGRLNLTASAIGDNIISFNESAKVFANSEKAIQSVVKLLGANFRVIEKPKDYIELSSRTHPKQNIWYNAKEINVHWDLAPGTEYSYLVSPDQTAVPDDVPDKPEGEKLWLGDIALSGLTDGIYYFTVKKIGSYTVSRYSIFQDITSPEWVSVALKRGTLETNGKDFISFLAKDSTSGIAYYEIQVDGGAFERISPPNYILTKSDYRRVVVRAYDKAGNSVEESIETKKGDYSIWIGAAFVVFVVGLMFVTSQRRKI